VLAPGRWGARTLGPPVEGRAVRSEWTAVGLKAFFAPNAGRRVEAGETAAQVA